LVKPERAKQVEDYLIQKFQQSGGKLQKFTLEQIVMVLEEVSQSMTKQPKITVFKKKFYFFIIFYNFFILNKDYKKKTK
jgi:DNA-binding TFAR19-related protein (PDSD5 family)